MISKYKCYRCGKVVNIPWPSLKKQRELGIFSWTAFIAMYLKWQLGWTILKGWTGEFICSNCHKEDDIIDDRKLSCTDEWLEKYNKWNYDNNK